MREKKQIINEITGNLTKIKAWRPVFTALTRDLFKKTNGSQPLDSHLRSAAEWLMRQQTETGGFSTQYSLLYGRTPEFPETTGYIIPTLINLHHYIADKTRITTRIDADTDKIADKTPISTPIDADGISENQRSNQRESALSASKTSVYLESARKAGYWLLSIQNKEGWFPGNYDKNPWLFDTGQIIFGLLALYRELKDEKFLTAAGKAGDWIVKQQDPEGFWQKYAYNDIPHTYYSRVSWALLELWKITQKEDYKRAAIKQLNWVLAQQRENGFFKNCSFFNDETPVLHTIAYTAEGLLESGVILAKFNPTRELGLRYARAAKKTADKLLELNRRDDPLFGYYDADWQPKSRIRCLTGLAQTSVIFFRLYEITKDPKYLKEAKKINHYLKTKQILTGPQEIRGGLAGSYPAWGKYMRFGFPNWAAKFWIDSLLLEEKYKRGHLVLAVFPGDPLIAYVKKGEMRKNYWNPRNIFSEIHLFDFCDHPYSEEDKNKLRFMTGDAEMFIHQIPFPGLRRLVHQHKIKKQLLNLAEKIDPDIIRSHGVFLEGFFGRYLSKKTGIPLVVSLHGDYDRDIRGQTFRRKRYLKYLLYLGWKYFAELKILRGASEIIAVYQFAADYALKNGIPAEKVHLIYNKVSSSVFFPDPRTPKDQKFTVIHVGRQIPEKNQKTLIEAVKDLDCELILVGQGSEQEELMQFARDLKIAEKIKFISKIDNKEMGTLYNRCHAYATANLYGGIEIPVIEAMACGLPIIRSKNPDEPEPELVGFDGCLFVENTPEGFRAGIAKLMSDRNLYRELSQKSLRIYDSVRSEKMEEKEKEVYLSLI